MLHGNVHNNPFIEECICIDALTLYVLEGKCPEGHGNLDEKTVVRDMLPNADAAGRVSRDNRKSCPSVAYRRPNPIDKRAMSKSCWVINGDFTKCEMPIVFHSRRTRRELTLFVQISRRIETIRI